MRLLVKIGLASGLITLSLGVILLIVYLHMTGIVRDSCLPVTNGGCVMLPSLPRPLPFIEPRNIGIGLIIIGFVVLVASLVLARRD